MGTNDVSSADKDDATGPPPPPMGTSTTEEGRGRPERVAVDVGKPIGLEKVLNRQRELERADEPTNQLFTETMAIDEASSPSRIEEGPGKAQACTRAASGARRAPTAADEAR